MSFLKYESLEKGTELPTLSVPAITHANLVRYAGASGDFNPIHNDPDFAKANGLDGTIAHGMFVMAQIGRQCTTWAAQKDIEFFGVKFKAMTKPGEKLTIVGTVKNKKEEEGKKLVTVSVEAKNDAGEVKAGGDLVIRF